MNNPMARQITATCTIRARVNPMDWVAGWDKVTGFIVISKHTAFYSQCHGSAFLSGLGKFPMKSPVRFVMIASFHWERTVVS